MARIDEVIATYLSAIAVERKTPRTIASYAPSLEDFRRVGRHSGLPEALEEYGVDRASAFRGSDAGRTDLYSASPGVRVQGSPPCGSLVRSSDLVQR